ncbi:thiamine pyrophosphate-binding protein [Aquincola sp. MAHUQ-54]|uniref:Thiamine pyrophosphate-binding protein n=1 Tax=Aquincola agrisoli TaxID=3119538 RepID=A0AAW9QCT6_9BURK
MEQNKMDKMTGAMYIAQCLKQEGVDKVFGQCGHTNYALIDACQRLGIEYVSFRHEQQAVHAADAYFRVSHRLAVINVHLSPGLTNALTGVATAAADGTPMVVIAGNTPSYHHAREAHQQMRLHADASQGDMFRPVCKRVWRVDDAKFLPDVMPRALNLAQTGRSGAVLVDVPMDVFSGIVEPAGEAPMAARRPAYRRVAGDAEGVARAAELLAKAQRPVIFAGNGVTLSDASAELAQLARRLHAPVATTLMGKGLYPEDDTLSLGTTGIWGTRAANDTTRTADVILAVGTAFGEADCSSWRPEHTFDIPKTRLIQIDIDPVEIGKSYPVEVGIVGDAKATLQALITRLGEAPRAEAAARAQLDQVAQRKAAWQQELTASQHDTGRPIHPATLLRELSEAAPDDAIFVTDVGWNKNGAGQQLQVKRPQSFITSGGMATMGFSPAAAIGAKLGAPNRKVIGLVGDGGLTSVMGALATSVELNIPVLWLLFNNFCFSTIRTVGGTYFKNTYGTEFQRPDGQAYNPDFMLMAQSFGIASSLIEDPRELGAGLRHALAQDRPYLLEVRTRGDLPMPRTGFWDIAEFLEGGNLISD